MKTIRRYRWLAPLGLVLPLLLLTPSAYAVFGVGDTTVIVEDLTDVWKWPREMAQWTALITNVTQQIQKTDELIKLAGDPEKVVKELIDIGPDPLGPLDEVMSLQTQKQALALAENAYALRTTAKKTIKDGRGVAKAFEAFGEKIERDPHKYRYLAMQEAMYERYQKAVKNENEVEKSETKVQREALDALKKATTEAEIEIFNARIAASKQRQDLAHQKAEQAKSQFDAFKGKLIIEDDKKAEADREWAQEVVKRMQKKALASYRTQVGLTSETE